MIVSIIVAYDLAGGIGAKGVIPWHISSDLKRFKSITMGHYIIMGRKTWDSIGRPLPGRRSIIITHQSSFHPAGAEIVHSLKEALDLAAQNGEQECFVIGGGTIYTQAYPFADRIYATQVQTTVKQADVFFHLPVTDQWSEVSTAVINEPGDEYQSIFKVLEKIKPPQS